MVRYVAFFACLTVIAGLLSGCASGTEGAINFANFAGTYQAAYTRATGDITISVEDSGQIGVTVVDSVEGTFVGKGAATSFGTFSITCEGPNNKTVTINGSLRGSSLGRNASGTTTGTINFSYNADFLSAPDTTIYTNHYEGLYRQDKQSDAGMNWFGDVSSDGKFSGTLLTESGTVALTGTVSKSGYLNCNGSANGTTYHMEGNFRFRGPQDTAMIVLGISVTTQNGVRVIGIFRGHFAEGG